jgi:HSP20 family protein
MVRRFHRSIYDELDELKASMDYLFQVAFEPMDDPLLLQEEDPGIVCQYTHTLNAEVSATDDEVAVTVDILPGCGMTAISARLVRPDLLKITCERPEAGIDGNDRDDCREQRSISLHHLIPLPVPVMMHGARTTLNHGVFDLRLKRVPAVSA